MSLVTRYGKAVGKQGWRIIGSYFAWMRKYAKHPEKYPLEERYKRVRELTAKVVKDLNVELIVEGKENIPENSVYYVGNHLSMLDPLSMIIILDKPVAFVGKKETENMPFVGKIMKDIEGEFLDREDLKQSLKVMMRVQKDLTEGTKNWAIFPEGTRNKDSMAKLNEFHHGTFRPAMKAGVPIVPIAFYGTQQALKSNPVFKKYPVFVKFLKPIMPEDYEGKTTNEVAIMVQKQVQAAVSFDLRKKYNDAMAKQKGYRFNKI